MSQVACCECSKSVPGAEAYELNGKVYCGPCVKAAAERAKAAGQPVAVARYVDSPFCARPTPTVGEGGGLAAGNPRFGFAFEQLVQNGPNPPGRKFRLLGF